ncbi:MAG TPA: adenine phosphoribosyltransferase [Terriglobales bacterium]|nr:adenine phosphoribosyltransferase [Terriglobales bacterium]
MATTPTSMAPTTTMNRAQECEALKAYIRAVPDFPKPGILFYDITTLLKQSRPFARVVDLLAEHYASQSIAVVAGIEARGFIFGPALAYRLGAGFVPIRKPRKLPAPTVAAEYSLEYGTDKLEIHRDAITAGQRVLIVDDLIATGGTAIASTQLIEQLGGAVAGLAFIVELTFLNGRQRLAQYDVLSLLQYAE